MGVLEFLWNQWNTLTAGGSTKLTPDQYHAIQDGIHIQNENLDALKVSKLVGDVTNTRSSSGPLPDTGKVVQTTGSADRIQFQPAEGEVWSFIGGDILETATGTFSVNFEFRDLDGNVALMTQSSSTGQEVIFDQVNMPLPVFFSNSLYLYANVTAGEGRISTAFIRVR